MEAARAKAAEAAQVHVECAEEAHVREETKEAKTEAKPKQSTRIRLPCWLQALIRWKVV